MSVGFLITLVIALIVVGAIVFVIDHVPIDATFKLIVKVIAIVGFVVWLLMELRARMG